MPAPLTEHGITTPGGDPEELRTVAGFLRTAADGFSQIAVNVRQAGATVGTSWTGIAASLFATRVGQTTAAIDTAPLACVGAAEALEELALQLEMAQVRALEAQAAAGGALETLAEVGRERDDLVTRPTGSDPDAVRALGRREMLAQVSLHTARTNGASAFGDAQEAARQAAVKLHAAADAFHPPLPRADSEVAPYESNAQWVGRQLGDLFYDPFAFWDADYSGEDGWYQRGRIVFDIKTAYLGGLAWGLYEQRHNLFRLGDPRGGLWVPGGTRYGSVTGLPLVGSHPLEGPGWVQRPSPVTVANVAAGGRMTSLNSVANRAGGALAFGTAALDQFMADRDRPDLDGGDKATRAAGAAVVVGGASVVGGVAGMKAGALIGAGIGSFIGGPGPGTAIGAVVGGAIGGIVGSGVGQALGNKAKDFAFNMLPGLFS